MSVILEARLPLLPIYRSSDLPRTRSCLITKALQTNAERLILIDSDIVPTLSQLQELSESDIVNETQALTGFYVIRGDNHMSIHSPAAQEGEVFEAEWAGLGFCSISRKSLETLASTLPIIRGDTMPWYPFCVPRIHSDFSYMGDDRSFWWRLSTVGVKLMAKRSLHVGHLDLVVR